MTLTERFERFFAAVNGGHRPYPWQTSLVERVARTGGWPDIAAPTGAGKSSVIDVHVFLVAEHAAGRLTTRPPRRLVMVAPRRVLVDDQYERALGLAEALRGARADPDSAAHDVALALAGIITTDAIEHDNAGPLLVWRLRGGVAPENGWRLDPAACQVICATPQMWGSRLLLRGFNASRRSRNLEAGLLGQDVVAIVDEAHLHERLVQTAREVAWRNPQSMGLQVVGMSATRAGGANVATLTDDDLSDPELARRVGASKSVQIVEVDDWTRDAATAIAHHAQERQGRGTVGVFVNDVPTALRVAELLGSDDSVAELVCGRMRLADLQRLRKRRRGLLGPAGNSDVDFLVTTQSLEVGVDLDFPAMVTALAPAAALAQRAGRLNRSGRQDGATFTVVCPAGIADADPEAIDASFAPYDAAEMVAGARWLESLGGGISPAAVSGSGVPLPGMPLLPGLSTVDLETLSMTSDVLSADPDVELYLDVPEQIRPEVGIAARENLDLDEEVVRAALIACPPRAHEVATMALGKQFERVLEAARDSAWLVRTEAGERLAMRLDPSSELQANDVLVVSAGALVCTGGVVGVPKGKGRASPLDDVLDEPPDDSSIHRVLRMEAPVVAPIVADDPALGGRGARRHLAEALDGAGQPVLAKRLRAHRRLSEIELEWCGGREADVGLLVVRDAPHAASMTPSINVTEPVTIDAHQAAVGARLQRIVAALGPEDLEASTEQLRFAAAFHDEGKRHPRFQHRMGGSELQLAKPLPGHRPDPGDGWRHEQLSAAYAAVRSEGDDLVVTLVAAHHGAGRPLFARDADELLAGWVDCPADVAESAHRLFGPLGRYELARSRIERRIGVHRLAYLEALVRCADMQVSREGG